MSLYNRIKRDNQKILQKKFSTLLKLTNRSEASIEIYGRYTDIGIKIDLETGAPIAGRQYTVGFHLDDTISIQVADETFDNWTVEFVNNNDETVIGKMKNSMINRTLGYVHSHLVRLV